ARPAPYGRSAGQPRARSGAGQPDPGDQRAAEHRPAPPDRAPHLERQSHHTERREGRTLTEQRFLGEILARRGVVDAERLEALYAVQREKGTELIDLLVNGNITDEAHIAQALAAEAELEYVAQVEPDKISTQLATRVPIAFAKSHKILVFHED